MSEVWEWMGGEKGWWKYQVAFQNVVTQLRFLLLSSSAELSEVIILSLYTVDVGATLLMTHEDIATVDVYNINEPLTASSV